MSKKQTPATAPKIAKHLKLKGKALTQHIKEIDLIVKNVVTMVKVDDSLSNTLRNDLLNRNANGSTELTGRFNEILRPRKEGEEDQDQVQVQAVKTFIRRRFQTLVKEVSVQQDILGEDSKIHKITIKKVSSKMILNEEGTNQDFLDTFLEKFTAKDLGQYRAVTMVKVKEELTLEENLMKWMKSVNLHEEGSFDTETVRALLDNIDTGKV